MSQLPFNMSAFNLEKEEKLIIQAIYYCKFILIPVLRFSSVNLNFPPMQAITLGFKNGALACFLLSSTLDLKYFGF